MAWGIQEVPINASMIYFTARDIVVLEKAILLNDAKAHATLVNLTERLVESSTYKQYLYDKAKKEKERTKKQAAKQRLKSTKAKAEWTGQGADGYNEAIQ